jgi:hypothetical protein
MTEKDDKRDEFVLLRDKILLGLGLWGFVAICTAGVFVHIKNPNVVLAALTLCGALLGAPTFLRIDEKRASKERDDD